MKESEINKQCLSDLNLRLTGVVTKVEDGNNFHGYGIIRIKIINSNIKEYNRRATQMYYFCVIKDGIAEIYDHTLNTSIGDTLFYDTKKQLGNKTKELGSISVNADASYYRYIEKYTIFR